MRYILSFFILCFCLSANGQFGAAIKFNNNGFSQWNNEWPTKLMTQEDIYNTGIEAGVHYWFRLKNKRIEFLPELFYATSSTQVDSREVIDLDYLQFGLNLNTQFYVFDLQGDCDCPTWSKDGNLITKGFFLSVSPGVNYNIFDVHRAEDSDAPLSTNSKQISYKIGVGGGIDIGINNLITVTPFVNYNFYPSLKHDALYEWEQLEYGPSDVGEETTSNGQLQFGLRLSFRPDYKY